MTWKQRQMQCGYCSWNAVSANLHPEKCVTRTKMFKVCRCFEHPYFSCFALPQWDYDKAPVLLASVLVPRGWELSIIQEPLVEPWSETVRQLTKLYHHFTKWKAFNKNLSSPRKNRCLKNKFSYFKLLNIVEKIAAASLA